MMTATQVLKWLSEHYEDDNLMIKVFNLHYVSEILDLLKPQEIVDRIEKYEAEKNKQEFKVGDAVRIVAYNSDHHFKIGDLAKVIDVYDRKSCIYDYAVEYLDGHDFWNVNKNDIEHAEPPKEEKKWCPTCKHQGELWVSDCCKYCNKNEGRDDNWEPKEEKQKIEKFAKECYGYFPTAQEAYEKINELVDAVNELRGV